jgi:hypothetical protein
MKPVQYHLAIRPTLDFGPPVAATLLLLLAAATLRADTPYTATGWVIGAPVLGIWCTNALGQVIMRGNAHNVRVDSSDPRLTGRRLIFVNGAAQADGTALIWGTSYQQVGTFNATNQFTPTGGIWENSYRGTMGADNSLELHSVGTGWGGAMDGLRIEETMTRAAASGPIDPTVPYLYTGTIKPPPLNTIELVSDFSGPFTYPQYGKGTCSNVNGQFHAVGDFRSATATFDDSYLFGQQNSEPGYTVTNGTTREWRADLVSLDDNATNMAQLVVSAQWAPGYGFFKGRDFAFLLKWSSQNLYSVLWCEQVTVPLPHTNVVMAVALTLQDPNVVITTRVLDKVDPNQVLFAHSYLDTPAKDTSLTTAQFQALTGMRITGLVSDAAEPPPTAKLGICLGLSQYTDGKRPVPTAVFDNLEMRTSEIPPLSIERAVRLNLPASAAITYGVQGAPTPQGPWLPVEDLAMPGFQTMTVPANSAAQFFQAIQAP